MRGCRHATGRYIVLESLKSLDKKRKFKDHVKNWNKGHIGLEWNNYEYMKIIINIVYS